MEARRFFPEDGVDVVMVVFVVVELLVLALVDLERGVLTTLVGVEVAPVAVDLFLRGVDIEMETFEDPGVPG